MSGSTHVAHEHGKRATTQTLATRTKDLQVPVSDENPGHSQLFDVWETVVTTHETAEASKLCCREGDERRLELERATMG